jgi:hypothetical protein
MHDIDTACPAYCTTAVRSVFAQPSENAPDRPESTGWRGGASVPWQVDRMLIARFPIRDGMRVA